jgi:Tol biopolymer transport system component
MFMTFFRRTVFTLAACLAVLGICGGGGGAGAVAGTTLPAGGQASPPASTPTGRLWHYDKNLVGREGSATSDIQTGAYRGLSGYRFPVPTADGSRFLENQYDSSDDTTAIWVRRSADGRAVDHFVVDGAIREIEFSPADSNLIRIHWGKDALSYSTYAVFNLAARRVIWADDDRTRTHNIAWLPDGRLLAISRAGVLSAISPAQVNQRSVLGSLSLPPGKLPFDLAVSPNGRQILVDLADVDGDGRALRHDYWLGSLDGSDLRPFTDTGGRVSNPIFSPDGQFVAFNFGFGASDLVSACELRYAPISARKVSRVSPDAKSFKGLKDANGKLSPYALGCELMAWLP